MKMRRKVVSFFKRLGASFLLSLCVVGMFAGFGGRHFIDASGAVTPLFYYAIAAVALVLAFLSYLFDTPEPNMLGPTGPSGPSAGV